MHSDYVTIEEAEERISQVRPLLESARRLKREIEGIAAGCGYNTLRLSNEKENISPLMLKLNDTIEQLEELGCYIKDLDVGLVDFLSTFEGRDIFLCWKLGEEHIAHWHETDEGFASRQEIVDMSQLCFDWEPELPETTFVENEN